MWSMNECKMLSLQLMRLTGGLGHQIASDLRGFVLEITSSVVWRSSQLVILGPEGFYMKVEMGRIQRSSGTSSILNADHAIM